MTVRTKTALRFSASVIASSILVCLLLTVLMRHAWADGVAAGQASVAPPHDVVTDPAGYGQDVVTAYRAGQWVTLALALFAGAFATCRLIARRWSRPAIGAFAAYIAAGVSIAATVVAMLVKTGSLDPTLIGSVAVTVALTMLRLPDGEPSPPRQAGHARLVIVATIAVALSTLAAACTRPHVAGVRGQLIDCGVASVRDLATDLTPAVAAILTGSTPTWRDQLDALLTVSTAAGACAVDAVTADLARRAKDLVGVHAEGQEATGAANGREYLAARGFVFEVR